MPKSGVRVSRNRRALGAIGSAAFHIAILTALALALGKETPLTDTPVVEITLAPSLEPPTPPIPVPPPPKPPPPPVEKVTAPTPTPAVAPAPQPAPAKQVATPTPVAAPAPKPAPMVQLKAPTPIAHAAPVAAPTPIAHTSAALLPAPIAPVLLPPAPRAAATASPPAAAAASAVPGAAAGSNGLRDALRLGFGCAHPEAVNLTPAERETCRKNGLAHAGPGFVIQPPDYIAHQGRANEAEREYKASNSQHDYPGLRCVAGRDCEPDPPTPSPDPINDTCPYLRCNMGSVR